MLGCVVEHALACATGYLVVTLGLSVLCMRSKAWLAAPVLLAHVEVTKNHNRFFDESKTWVPHSYLDIPSLTVTLVIMAGAALVAIRREISEMCVKIGVAQQALMTKSVRHDASVLRRRREQHHRTLESSSEGTED